MDSGKCLCDRHRHVRGGMPGQVPCQECCVYGSMGQRGSMGLWLCSHARRVVPLGAWESGV